MKAKKRLEIVWETHEITTISFKRGFPARVFCQSCKTETPHLTVSESASILKFSETAIFRFVEAKQLHSVENAAGFLLVCGKSLSALADETEKRK